MSAKTSIAVFIAVFLSAVTLFVIVPFVIVREPEEPGEQAPSEAAGAEVPPEFAERGVFRSDDGGETWKQKAFVEGEIGSIAQFKINAVIPDPVSSDTFYLATDGNGFWVTRSRGDLWTQVRDVTGVLEPDAKVFDIAVNPANTDEWYAAVFQKNRGRVLATADGGRSFREIYFTSIDRFGVFDVYYDAGRGAVVIVTGQGGYIETPNKGRTWRVVRWFADGLNKLMVNPANTNVRFVVTPRGSIFRTLDGGASWQDITPALNQFSGATRNQSWFMDAGGTLWLGSKHGLLRSRDNGATFEEPPLIIPPDALPVLAVSIPPGDLARVTVAANGELYASGDGGKSWSILRPPSPKRVTGLAADRENPKTIYAVVSP